MATPPDFSVGAVLTAAQMNAVGLWLIKEQTVGTGVTSVTISDCFSADYDNYKIIISGVDCSLGYGNRFLLRLANVANHFGSMYADLYTGGVSQFFRTNAATSFELGFVSTGDDANYTFDIINPQIAKRTTWHGFYHAATIVGWYGGYYNATTQFTDIEFLAGAGTMTGGKIRVYGYRK